MEGSQWQEGNMAAVRGTEDGRVEYGCSLTTLHCECNVFGVH